MKSLFVEAALKDNLNIGWNGSSQFISTNDDVTTLFYKIVRGLSKETIEYYMEKIYKNGSREDKINMFVLVFQTRATRSMGKGERKLFYEMMVILNKFYGDNISKLLHYIPEFGYYKDYINILSDDRFEKVIHDTCIDILCNDSKKDYHNLVINKHRSFTLVAKYLPREKGPYGNIAKKIAYKLFGHEHKQSSLKKYRCMKSQLNKALETTEVKMCEKSFRHINFKKVPSACLKRNRKAFLNEDLKIPITSSFEETGNRYPYDSDRVTSRKNLKGIENVNGSELYPYEIIKEFDENNLSETELNVLQKQWESIRGNLNLSKDSTALRVGKTIPVIDTSGSMTGIPMQVAISLGILLSEVCDDEFKDFVISFSSEPEITNLKDISTVKEKYEKITKMKWGHNTNLYKVFQLILKIAKQSNLNEKDIPDIMIISDMQFDYIHEKGTQWNTVYEKIVKLFNEYGIENHGTPWSVPRIAFWNVTAATDGVPVTAETPNTSLLSGFSPSLFKNVLSGQDMTPKEVLKRILYDTKFENIRKCCSTFIK
tara:strand:+ start:6968 stop:8593 length:1626 start_codon:yes stop_codon:yes gene_type:complete